MAVGVSFGLRTLALNPECFVSGFVLCDCGRGLGCVPLTMITIAYKHPELFLVLLSQIPGVEVSWVLEPST